MEEDKIRNFQGYGLEETKPLETPVNYEILLFVFHAKKNAFHLLRGRVSEFFSRGD